VRRSGRGEGANPPVSRLFAPKPFADGFLFPEGPRWRGDRLWISDQHAHQVVAIDSHGGKQLVATLDDMPSGLGWMPDGSLLVACMRTRRILRVQDRSMRLHADLSDVGNGYLNDMVVDARGRAYVGHRRGKYTWPAPDNAEWLVLVYPDGRHLIVADDMTTPNGSVISPDGRTLIVAETRAQRLRAFDIVDDGSLKNSRTFAQLEGENPDGICMDIDGAVWIAGCHSRFCRVYEGGQVVNSITISGGIAVACALGGPDRRRLYMIVTNVDTGHLRTLLTSDDDAKSDSRGRIDVADVAVSGAGWP
jgi:sugar lactone lactonase YvrE